jgi:hypothetical protein
MWFPKFFTLACPLSSDRRQVWGRPVHPPGPSQSRGVTPGVAGGEGEAQRAREASVARPPPRPSAYQRTTKVAWEAGRPWLRDWPRTSSVFVGRPRRLPTIQIWVKAMVGKGKRKIEAIGYMRTSSATNVGRDKDSEARQRAAIESYAKAISARRI